MSLARKSMDLLKAIHDLMNLLECHEYWTKALNKGFGIDLHYLDFSKAFDGIPIKWLIEK